jgi:thiol-disulfide isomerase/thioredoxin
MANRQQSRALANPPGRKVRAFIACLAFFTLLGTRSFAQAAEPLLRTADAKSILDEIRKPGATAVLVNVWATWCEPCREEMPSLLRFYREHREEGLRLLLVSVDDETNRDKVTAFLASQGIDFPTWIKRGSDRALMQALDPEWNGILPASFLFKDRGRSQYQWFGTVNDDELRMLWGQGRRRHQGRPSHRRPSRAPANVHPHQGAHE